MKSNTKTKSERHNKLDVEWCWLTSIFWQEGSSLVRVILCAQTLSSSLPTRNILELSCFLVSRETRASTWGGGVYSLLLLVIHHNEILVF